VAPLPLDLLEDTLQADTAVAQSSTVDKVTDYLRQPNMQQQLDPLEWWCLNQQQYPHMAV